MNSDKLWKELPSFRWVGLAGGLLAAMAAVVMAGWLIGSPGMVNFVSDGSPMVFNTALCFLLTGLGLCAHTYGRPKLGSILGGIVAVCGAVILTQFFTKENLGIDEFFIHRPFQTDGSTPGRVSPTAATAFAATGLALVLMGNKRFLPRTLMALVVVVMVLSFLALGGYFTGLRSSVSWVFSTGMALATALSFLIVGLAILVFVARHPAGKKDVIARTLPFFAAAASLLAVVGALAIMGNLAQTDSELLVTHTQEVMANLGELMTDVTEAESSARGYLLSGTQDLEEARSLAVSNTEEVLNGLRELVKDNPVEVEAMKILVPLVRQRLDATEAFITIRQTQGLEAGAARARIEE
ncbi:MAG TPA: CHASE3 domain-containing protein, partial [Opitutaceae bacterium]|nr:CHASE3 domain-containing protein [Opitutaceae bacterium]